MSGGRRPAGGGYLPLDPYQWDDDPGSLAPWVPSPLPVVREMLRLAGAGPGDVLYDLGCGDGRVLFAAVEEYGVRRAVGFELNVEMVEGVREEAEKRGIAARVEVRREDFMEADLREATIVAIYLTTGGNAKLRPRLEEMLRDGSRVVSHDFPVQGWTTVNPDGGHDVLGSHWIFFYRVPDCLERG